VYTSPLLGAFNWATRVRAWKPLRPNRTRAARKCFNWATRVRAWKPHLKRFLFDAETGFNWATRVRAWKPTSDDASAGRYYFASIGPRASARGNPFLGFVLFVSFEPLQLGHARPRVETRPACFNPAHLYAGFNWATRVRAWKPV